MKIKYILKVVTFILSCSTLGSATASAGPVELSDAQILGIYTQVNSFDIETALLGMSQGCSKGVKDLAKHLSTDHLAVRKGVLELAQKQGIEYILPSARVDAQKNHNDTMAKLSGLGCPEFDQAFLKHDVAFHTAAIEAVRTLLIPSTKNAVLKKHFQSVLPAFEKHLAMTKNAANGKSTSIHNKHEQGAK